MESVKKIIEHDIEMLEKYKKDLETAEFIVSGLRRQSEESRLVGDYYLIIDAQKETLEALEKHKEVLASLEPSDPLKSDDDPIQF